MENIDEYKEIQKDVFRFLDDLRDSGQINMFGATSYIMDYQGCNKKQAQTLLSEWMQQYKK
jgi:hypothetical protein